MRLFPRTARRRLVAAAAACVLTTGALAVPLASAVPLATEGDLNDKQDRVRRDIRSAQHDFGESSKELRDATYRLDAARAGLADARAELTSVRTRLAAAKVRDEQMQERLVAAEARLAQAEADLVQGRHDLADQQDAVADTITSIYQGESTDVLAISSFLEAASTEELTRRAQTQSVMVSKETGAFDELTAAEVLLEVREQHVREAKAEVAKQRAEAAAHLVTMQALRASAVEARDRVGMLVDARRGARQDAIEARRRDQAHLVELRREENRIRQQILALARRQASQTAGSVYRGATGGFLNRPVPGPVTSPFGYRTHPIYRYWGLHNGDDYRAGCGQALWAAADGTVISTYYSSVYGNRLFLSLGMVNGKNLTVVYNHLSGYAVSNGQRVSRGQTVGYGGTTGWSTACHLHFTVLVNGTPANPASYY